MRITFKAIIIYSLLFTNMVSASGNNWSFYSGMFDFSDEGKKSNLFGNLFPNKSAYFLVNLSLSMARTFVLGNFRIALE